MRRETLAAAFGTIGLSACSDAPAPMAGIDAAPVDATTDAASPAAPCAPLHRLSADAAFIDNPILGIDAQGDVVALWKQGPLLDDRPGGGSVYAGRFDRDAGWAPASPLAYVGSGASYALAVDPSGHALAVWQHDLFSADHRIWMSRYVPGDGWTSTTDLPVDTPADLYGTPAVVVDGSEDAIVVWRAEDGVRAMHHGASGWEASRLLDDGGDTYAPRIVIGPDGVAMASWHRHEHAKFSLRVSSYAPGVGWETPASLDTRVDEGVGDAAIGFDRDGNAIATWSHLDEPRQNWAARYAAGTGWEEAVHLELPGASSLGAHIAVAASGDAVAVWSAFVETASGPMPRVAAATYDPAVGWSAAALLQNEYPAFGEDVGIDAEGHAIAVWHEFEPSPTGTITYVYARRFVPGAGWGERFRLLEEPSRDPRLVMNAAGDAVVTSMSWTGTGTVLYACAYR